MFTDNFARALAKQATDNLSPFGSGFNTRTLYDDINFEGIGLATGNSAPDLITLYGQGNIVGRSFDGVNTLEQLYGGDEIRHTYAEGEDIYPHIHWMPTTNDAGNVKWILEYAWYNTESMQVQPIVRTISIVDSTGGVAWFPHVIHFPTISGVNMKIGSHFRFRLYRDPSDAQDTYEHDVVLDSFGLHIPINSDGSREIGMK